MGDVLFVAVVIAFFALAVAYVRGCARVVGEDEVVRVGSGGATEADGDDRGASAA